MKTTIIDGKEVPVVTPAKVTTTIKNKHTEEIYKTEEEWKAKGIAEDDIRRDVHVLMPNLDLFSKTK
jgi:carbonic anhydrase/acetyltransferase-like protein (isoleucine patch superfamily)